MSTEILQYLPQQWVGLFAVIMFIGYITMQVIEKYPTFAKIMPFGTWWHERQKTKRGKRNAWVAEDNEVIQALQLRFQPSPPTWRQSMRRSGRHRVVGLRRTLAPQAVGHMGWL